MTRLTVCCLAVVLVATGCGSSGVPLEDAAQQLHGRLDQVADAMRARGATVAMRDQGDDERTSNCRQWDNSRGSAFTYGAWLDVQLTDPAALRDAFVDGLRAAGVPGREMADVDTRSVPRADESFYVRSGDEQYALHIDSDGFARVSGSTGCHEYRTEGRP